MNEMLPQSLHKMSYSSRSILLEPHLRQMSNFLLTFCLSRLCLDKNCFIIHLSPILWIIPEAWMQSSSTCAFLILLANLQD